MSIKQGGVTIAGGSSTVTDMDNITITKNAYSKIQTVGQTNKNTATGAENYLYDWVGTLEEYNTQDIVTNHPEWICYITDDDIGSVINDSTITIKQGGITKGFFTLNQDTNKTINLDAGGGGGGTVAIDEVTITENGENKIQASATRNANLSNTSTTSVFDWVGTYQEYSDQNIAVNHPTWICFITDDIEGGVVTKTVSPESGSNSNDVVTTEYENRFRTNCVMEIPQDIKLELNGRTLKLKAGSKLYYPNGFEADNTTMHFDTFITASDLTLNLGGSGWTNEKHIIVVNNNGTSSSAYAFQDVYSGATAPTSLTTQYGVWYDTTNNLIKRTIDSGTTWISNYSFPVCVAINTGGTCDSIYQIFNGLGYIGSITFALPGVKGLCPDGRNADGTLNNNVKTLTSVTIFDMSIRGGLDILYLNTNNEIKPWDFASFYTDKYPAPEANKWHLTYSTIDNCFYVSDNGAAYTKKDSLCFVGKVQCVYGGNISFFTSNTTFRAVDYNEADFVIKYQKPTPTNNYTWFRKYKSGWVEQGGIGGNGSTTTPVNVDLPVPMMDENYSVMVCFNGSTSREQAISAYRTSTTRISLYHNANSNYMFWRVEGFAA